MTCPYLEYRDGDETHAFDEARAYCTVADRFVQPMRADICNDRFTLEHASHCEIYRAHVADASEEAEEAEPSAGMGAEEG